MVKAQIHAGGRGKAGGVKVVKSLDDVKKEATETKENLGAVKTEVSTVKTEVATTKSELDKTIATLKSVQGDLGVESGRIATNSKGHVFVYTRTGHPTLSLGTARPFAHGGSRMFRFDKTGKYVGEIGQNSYAFLYAEKVKVDPQDNIWVVDQMSNTDL